MELLELTSDDMVFIPLSKNPAPDDEYIEIAFLDIEGRRTAPVYTNDKDTVHFPLNDTMPIYWHKFNFGLLMSILDDSDQVGVNIGSDDAYLFDVAG